MTPAAAAPIASPRAELRQRNWDALGLERDGAALRAHVAFLDELRRRIPPPIDRVTAEDRNLADVSWAMAASAEFREESRGGHFRLDFPQTDDGRFLGHTLLEGGRLSLAPIEVTVAAGTT